MPERFPRLDVGKMHFNERDIHPGKGVTDCNAGMCVRARVDKDETRALPPSLLNTIDKCALMVALETLNIHASAVPCIHEAGIDVIERFPTVDLRFPCAKQIQVRPMQDQDAFYRSKNGCFQSYPRK